MWEIIYGFIVEHGAKITFVCLVLAGFISLICFAFFPDIPKNFDPVGLREYVPEYKRDYRGAKTFFPQVFAITFVTVWAFVFVALWFAFKDDV